MVAAVATHSDPGSELSAVRWGQGQQLANVIAHEQGVRPLSRAELRHEYDCLSYYDERVALLTGRTAAAVPSDRSGRWQAIGEMAEGYAAELIADIHGVQRPIYFPEAMNVACAAAFDLAVDHADTTGKEAVGEMAAHESDLRNHQIRQAIIAAFRAGYEARRGRNSQ